MRKWLFVPPMLFLSLALLPAVMAETQLSGDALAENVANTNISENIFDQALFQPEQDNRTVLCSCEACDTPCGVGCICGDNCQYDGGCGCLTSRCPLNGLIKPSDRCFDDFISPMINFVHFEDPRTVTEIRPIFVHQNVPGRLGPGAIPAGGSVQLYAMHFRAALTDRLSLVGVKDGYIVDKTGGTLDNLLDDGWAAVTAGLKYNLVRDVCKGRLVTVGANYELPVGSQRALQDVGDGEFHLYITLGQRLLCGDAHFLTSFGYRVPVNDNLQTTSVHWSNHIDFRLTEKTYIFTEVAWWHWTDDATNGTALGVAGQDLFNLSASNVAGNDLVTQSVGVKFKPCRSTEIGIAYEFPLTDFEDIIEDRFIVDLIFRY